MILLLDPAGKHTINLKRYAPTLSYQRATSFPPGPGQWFQAPDTVVLGCLRCKGLYSVDSKFHRIDQDGGLHPSWTCVLCGNHTVIRLAGYARMREQDA